MKFFLLCLLIVFFIIVDCFSKESAVFAQDVLNIKVTVKEQEASLKRILEGIERQARIQFAYNETKVRKVKGLRIDAHNESIRSVLEKIKQQQPIAYEVAGNIIVVRIVEATDERPSFKRTILGTITNELGEPLPGASVMLRGTSFGTLSNPDGHYRLVIPNDTMAVLTVSSVGYETKNVQIASGFTYDIRLIRADYQLNEIVVVGYGTQPKGAVTGAITSVKSAGFSNQQIERVEQVLRGRTSGLTITAASGAPGADATVRVRGITSFSQGANNPLYVVDGVVVDPSSINFLNSSDIESIEVLKDAAAAAIYGARASAGVILISTKKGKEGKTRMTYNGYVGFQKPEKKLDILNASQYAALINEQAMNDHEAPVFSDPQNLGAGTDWQDYIFNNNAPIQNHEISLSGGGKASSFFTSAGYFDQDGIVASDISNFKRLSLRLNASHQIRKWLTVGQNLGYAHIKSLMGVNSNNEFQGPLSSAINMDPLTPVIETDPSVLAEAPYNNHPVIRDPSGNPYGLPAYASQQITNPLAFIQTRLGNYNWSDDIVGNVFVEVKPLSGLSFRSTTGVRLGYYGTENFVPIYYLGTSLANEITSFSRFRAKIQNWNVENTVAYSNAIDAHHFHFLAGQGAYLENNSSGTRVVYYGIPATSFKEASMNYSVAAENVEASGFEGILHKVNSLFARLNYNYDEKYMFTGIIRRDGSSRFGPNNRFGYFPSASMGWVLSRENFFPKKAAFSFLKLRASYGVTGNDFLGDLVYAATVSDGRNYFFGDDVYAIGSSPNAPANPDLKWEETRQLNLGLDAVIFKHCNLAFDWFDKQTSGVLMPIELPAYAGTTGTSYGNIGDIRNRGLELEINYEQQFNALRLSLSGNLSYLKNEVTFLGNGKTYTEDGAPTIQNTQYVLTRTAVGHPVGAFYGFVTDGIFQNQAEIEAYTVPDGDQIQPNAVPGDFRWKDLNNDGKIDALDRTFIGDPSPDLTYGFSVNLSWKQLDFLLFGEGVAGNQIYQGLRRLDIPTANWQTNALNRWHGEGTSNSYPRLSKNDANKNFSLPSVFYLQNGSFLRLKTIQLGYTLPEKAAAPIGCEKIRIYVSSHNPFLFSKYSGYNPEIGGTSFRIDRGVYPQAKSLLLGLNFVF
ncbi:TonB-dependent receptor [Niabella insulamsoli]|uniref:TonB-dependent receptor n=1 Tax=Niabella insulamsoli TaxID=3144874 RepID=UPI0031FD2F2F